jgi:hypothetical protein
MAAEIVALQQFLEVVRKSYRVELDSVVRELLDSGRVYVPVDKALFVKELKALDHLLQGVEDFDGAHPPLGVGLPLGQDGGALHLYKNELVRDHPVVVDVDQVFMFELRELLDDEDGLGPLAFVERADINAGHHALALMVFNDEYFSIALLEVKTFDRVGVVHRVADLLL